MGSFDGKNRSKNFHDTIPRKKHFRVFLKRKILGQCVPAMMVHEALGSFLGRPKVRYIISKRKNYNIVIIYNKNNQ